MAFDGGVNEAVDYYINGSSLAEDGLIIDSIQKKKSYLDLKEILINGTPANRTSLKPRQEFLDIVIRGTTQEAMKCEVKFIIKKMDGTPMAALIEGQYTGKLLDLPTGTFEIIKHVRLPKYLADGEYLVDLMLHQPYIQNFFVAINCLTLNINGFCDAFAHPLRLNEEGFIGLCSE